MGEGGASVVLLGEWVIGKRGGLLLTRRTPLLWFG